MALAAIAVASSSASPTRPEVVKPERAVAGSVVGPSRDALARRLPVAVAFASAERGFLATGDGRVLTTVDRGRTWHRVGPRARFVRLDFLTAEHGFALTAADSVLETRDGGRSWRRLHSFPHGSRAGLVGALHFVDERHGFLVALDGHIYRTADGGHAWTRLPFPCPNSVGGGAFLDARRGLALCGGVRVRLCCLWRGARIGRGEGRSVPWPEGPGPVVAAKKRMPGLYAPLKEVRRAIPKTLPKNPPQTCNYGAKVQITLSGGQLRTYGPCERPTSIERLRLALIDAVRAGRSLRHHPPRR